jgi:uncharacterized lipoprotein YddW (UPF0748 family)
MTKCFFICFLFLFTIALKLPAQAPKRELRAAWVATVSNIDWPSSAGLTAANQQTQFINILNEHKASGMNAIFVQIRTECDALYANSFEPWSKVLTGTQGTNPGYDPLQFMITECRKRGMEFHAWFNPYRAVINFGQIGTFASNHIAVTRPDLLLSQGTLRVLDPGKPEVWDYVIKIVMDVVRRYDIDGVHFDDYFYPYPPSSGLPYNDDATFTAFPRGFTVKADWRRANVDTLIKRANDSIHTAKPWVKFGVSPFGIWRNQSSDATGSATSGLQSYSDVYANSKKWIQSNWVDYLAPQIYWSIGLAVANYGVLVPWWNNLGTTRPIYSGMAAYKVNNGGTDANWNNPSMIPNEIRLNRQNANVVGSIFYNTTAVNSNPLGMRDSLRNDLWARAAIVPRMSWIDNTAPAAPTATTTTLQGTNNVLVQWTAPPATTVELDKARQYVVYRFNVNTPTLTDSSAIRTVTGVDTVRFVDANVPNGTYYYTVTALDRIYNESTTSTVSMIALGATSVNNLIVELDAFKVLQVGEQQLLVYTLSKKANVSLVILNNNGQSLFKQNYGAKNTGTYSIANATPALKKGVYYAQLVVNGKIKTVKFIR